MSPIVDPIGEDDRRREVRINLARKAIWLRERSARTDANGRISAEDNAAAMQAAGLTPPTPPPDIETAAKIARLEAAVEHRLSPEEVDSLTGTTAEEIAAEVDALRPPGDGGARGMMPISAPPLDEAIREAEQAGDIKAAMSLKSQKLLDLKHANNPR